MKDNPWVVTNPITAMHHIRSAYKYLSGRSLKKDDAGMSNLVAILVSRGMSPAGYVELVASETFSRLNANDIYSLKYLGEYTKSLVRSVAIAELVVESTLSSFAFAQKLDNIEVILGTPRHDINPMMRWCLVKRHKLIVEDHESLEETAAFYMALHPSFYQCSDDVPEMLDLPFWPIGSKDHYQSGGTI